MTASARSHRTAAWRRRSSRASSSRRGSTATSSTSPATRCCGSRSRSSSRRGGDGAHPQRARLGRRRRVDGDPKVRSPRAPRAAGRGLARRAVRDRGGVGDPRRRLSHRADRGDQARPPAARRSSQRTRASTSRPSTRRWSTPPARATRRGRVPLGGSLRRRDGAVEAAARCGHGRFDAVNLDPLTAAHAASRNAAVPVPVPVVRDRVRPAAHRALREPGAPRRPARGRRRRRRAARLLQLRTRGERGAHWTRHAARSGRARARQRFIEAGLEYASAQWEPLRFRLWVARWNERALRAYRRAGFREVQSSEPSRFLEMERPA